METKILVGKNNDIPLLRLPYKEIDGAFVIMSFRHQRISLAHLDYYFKYPEPQYPTEAFVTFFYATENFGAEWEPSHGPIQLYQKCDQDWKGECCFGKPIKAKQHWFFDYVQDQPASWSQLAVDENKLKPALATGDFEHIFSVLTDWANREQKDNN